jgi:hypothetical protein
MIRRLWKMRDKGCVGWLHKASQNKDFLFFCGLVCENGQGKFLFMSNLFCSTWKIKTKCKNKHFDVSM